VKLSMGEMTGENMVVVLELVALVFGADTESVVYGSVTHRYHFSKDSSHVAANEV
jgi:hypothetical protein